jgi:hypothetical protein
MAVTRNGKKIIADYEEDRYHISYEDAAVVVVQPPNENMISIYPIVFHGLKNTNLNYQEKDFLEVYYGVSPTDGWRREILSIKGLSYVNILWDGTHISFSKYSQFEWSDLLPQILEVLYRNTETVFY